VVIDGFRPDHREFGRTPNLDALMKQGVTYTDSWVGQLMNVTPPGHVGLSTGLLPDKTDVSLFAWKDQNGVLHQYYSYDNAIAGVTNRMLAAKGIKGVGSRYQAACPQAVTAAVTAGNFYTLSALPADGVDVELGCDMTGVNGVESSAPHMSSDTADRRRPDPVRSRRGLAYRHAGRRARRLHDGAHRRPDLRAGQGDSAPQAPPGRAQGAVADGPRRP
jgi:hypothetical protein